jgi:uncharacterized surface protein with fasciclin (FAS1) repeats
MTDKTKIVVVLILLAVISGLTIPASAQTATSQRTMLQNLVGNSDFSKLAGATKTAGLDATLNGATPYTLFAPNNAAFNKIPGDQVSALQNDKTKLTSLLNYHVVPGKISYADLASRTSLTTTDGKTLPVARQADGSIMVGGTKVLGQGIDSSNGMIYPVDSVMIPPGFVMPQAAQGFPWWLIPLVLLGLGALALYLMTRPRRHAEPTPRRRYAEQPPAEKARPGYEERARTEEMRRPQETMMAREPVSVHREPQIADIAKNLSLPLSGVALTGLNALISKGTFSDKQDFVGFLAKTFMANDLGSAMAGGKEPSESMIMDIIGKTGIARGFSSDDTKNMLVPLLITGFTAVYNYLNKRPEARTT